MVRTYIYIYVRNFMLRSISLSESSDFKLWPEIIHGIRRKEQSHQIMSCRPLIKFMLNMRLCVIHVSNMHNLMILTFHNMHNLMIL